jgi:hypothetical protein
LLPHFSFNLPKKVLCLWCVDIPLVLWMRSELAVFYVAPAGLRAPAETASTEASACGFADLLQPVLSPRRDCHEGPAGMFAWWQRCARTNGNLRLWSEYSWN